MAKYVDVTVRLALKNDANQYVALEEVDWTLDQLKREHEDSDILGVYFIDARKVTEKEL